jgi:hypothetical protein
MCALAARRRHYVGFVVIARTVGPHAQEAFMAKGHKRSNREIRKPKKPKTLEAIGATPFTPRGPLARAAAPKKER